MQKLDLEHCFRTIPEPPDFVLPGMLHGTVGALVSPGASGKSYFALQLGIQICSGADVLHWNTPLRTGGVVYLAGEDPRVALHHRLYELGKLLSCEERNLVAERFSIYPLSGDPDAPSLSAPSSEHGLIDLCRGNRLLIVDTLRRFHAGDENNSGEMSRLVNSMEHIAHESGVSVLFLHHTSKSAAVNGTLEEQQSSRGSSVLTDNARWQAYLSTMTKAEAKANKVDENSRGHYVRFGISKYNYCAPFSPIWLERRAGGVLRYIDFEEDSPNSNRRIRNEE